MNFGAKNKAFVTVVWLFTRHVLSFYIDHTQKMHEDYVDAHSIFLLSFFPHFEICFFVEGTYAPVSRIEFPFNILQVLYLQCVFTLAFLYQTTMVFKMDDHAYQELKL
jgi:hypothetical protein